LHHPSSIGGRADEKKPQRKPTPMVRRFRRGFVVAVPAKAGDFYRAFRLGLRLDGERLPPAPSNARG